MKFIISRQLPFVFRRRVLSSNLLYGKISPDSSDYFLPYLTHFNLRSLGILLDIFICIIIASIIGYVSGCYLPAAILNIVSVIVGIIILLLYGGPIMNQLEIVIKQLLIYNFQQYMDSQNIISQIIS